jgi:hypothetical protein
VAEVSGLRVSATSKAARPRAPLRFRRAEKCGAGGATSKKVCATEVEAASVFQPALGQHTIAAYGNCQN